MNTIRPAIVMPMYDPNGVFIPHLIVIAPYLKTIFDRALISIPDETRAAYPDNVSQLELDPFFEIVQHPKHSAVGDDFLTLYRHAAQTCARDQVLHLCFIDRIAYALLSEHRETALQDMASIKADHTPLIFQRSTAAWATHPANYRQIEGMVTQVGELLFARTLDYAWCHLTFTAGQLGDLLPAITRRDMAMVAEFILPVRESVQTRTVDWLAWEDPFIEGREPTELKAERETSRAETLKRLNYVVPMLELLRDAARVR